mgnify:CR=1 FL=1
MIREREPRHPPFEYRSFVRVLPYRTKVEDPVVLAMLRVEPPFGILALVAVERLEPGSWVAHDDDSWCNLEVDQPF